MFDGEKFKIVCLGGNFLVGNYYLGGMGFENGCGGVVFWLYL